MISVSERIANAKLKDIYLSIRKHGTVSKQTLLEESGLTISTLTRILEELCQQELILEVGYGESTGGRRPILYETHPHYGRVFGLEISRTRSRLALLDLHLNLLDEYIWVMDETMSPDRLLGTVCGQAERMMAEHKVSRSRLLGLGIGAVGPLDRKRGILLSPPGFAAHGWDEVPLQSRLEERLGVPVLLDNGANAALLGEYWASGDRRLHRLLYVHAGIGLRSAVMNDGRLLHGNADTEAAVGQMIIESAGVPPLTGGGNYGAWESYVSINALLKQAQDHWKRGRRTMLEQLAGSPERLRYGHLTEALSAGDPLAGDLFEAAAGYFGIGLSNLINVLHPQDVILGGPLLSAGDRFMEEAVRIARERTYYPDRSEIRFGRSKLGDAALATGAGALVVDSLTR